MRCKTHCPGTGSSDLAVAVAATVAVLAALVAVAMFIAAHAVVLAAGLVLVAGATAAFYRFCLARTVQYAPWLARARARAALPPAEVPAALSGPRLAIEPHRVIDGVVIHDRARERR